MDCPHDCPCELPKQGLQSQQRPIRSIEEVIETRGFARKNEDGRAADRRLANRRLRPFDRRRSDTGVQSAESNRFSIRLRAVCPPLSRSRFQAGCPSLVEVPPWTEAHRRRVQLPCVPRPRRDRGVDRASLNVRRNGSGKSSAGMRPSKNATGCRERSPKHATQIPPHSASVSSRQQMRCQTWWCS
jgi:hypothetical protein